MEFEEGIKIAAVHPDMGKDHLPFPFRKTTYAAGYDCHAAIDEPLEIWPGRLVKVPLGFALALPEDIEGQVRPRSGLASRGLIMPNSPGTIDADYRGEVSALLFNLSQEAAECFHMDTHVTIRPGERICQIVFARCIHKSFRVVSRASLGETTRGEGGFGSTGVK